jgi:hypothetical protein
MSGPETGRLDEAKEQVQEQAEQVAEKARGNARSMVGERSTQAGEQIGQQVSDVRSIAEQLREQGKEGPAKLAEQAADRADRLGSYLRDSDADRILGDVERIARTNPWAVIAGGIAIGFAASRFLKASSRERYRTSAAEGSSRPELPRTTTTPQPAGQDGPAAPPPVSAPPAQPSAPSLGATPAPPKSPVGSA